MNHQQQGRKPTPLETAQAVLDMLNKMNVASSQVLLELVEEFPASSEAFIRMNERMTTVINGITSLTTIYQEAAKRAQAAESNSQRNMEELSELPTERGQGARDLSARPNTRLSNSAIEQASSVLTETTRRVGEIAERIQGHAQQITRGPTPVVSPVDALRLQTAGGESVLDKLLGDGSVLFQYLSANHHPLGRGNIQVTRQLPAYVENIQAVPVEELVDYPQGFYDTKTGGPQELYLKTGDMEFLWIFGGDPRQFYMRRDGDWINAQTLSRTTLTMMTNRVETHLAELSNSL